MEYILVILIGASIYFFLKIQYIIIAAIYRRRKATAKIGHDCKFYNSEQIWPEQKKKSA